VNKKSDPKTTEDSESDQDILIQPPADKFELNFHLQMNKPDDKTKDQIKVK
jgi:hypothetical protein